MDPVGSDDRDARFEILMANMQAQMENTFAAIQQELREIRAEVRGSKEISSFQQEIMNMELQEIREKVDQRPKVINSYDVDSNGSLKARDSETKNLTEERQNQYQPGDFVLYQRDPAKPLPAKFVSRFKSPFEVQDQRENGVTAKHLAQSGVVVFHNDDFKIFHVKKKRKIVAYCPAFNDRFTFDRVFVFEFSSVKRFNIKTMELVDTEFVKTYPEFLGSSGTPAYTTT